MLYNNSPVIEKVTFNNKLQRDFVNELKENVHNYFETNKLSTYGSSATMTKAIIMISLYIVPLVVMYAIDMHPAYMFICYGIMAFGIVGIGCAVQHDANHGAFSDNHKINKFLGLTLDLIGGNSYLWRIKHNILHHTYTNIYGKDEDISVAGFLRMSPNAPWKPIHKYQHILAWFAYSFLTLSWVFIQDFVKLKRYNGYGSPNPEVKHPKNEIAFLYFVKMYYILVMFVLPIFILQKPVWVVLLGFVMMHMMAGMMLTVVFQLAHVVEETDFPSVDENGDIHAAWFVHQMETTANFATNVKALSWFIGGLNHQVEHHLFPKICSDHYPALSKIVERTAKKYNVPYYNNQSFFKAVASHHQMLKKFSKP